MYQDKMAMISDFSKLVVLLVTAEVTSALNSPVPVVQTVSSVTLISGREATLTCNYNRTVFAVYWRYESTTSPIELLLALDKFYEEGKIDGPGYDEGRFNITDDYSLIIHDVQATDEGKYICEVADYEKGQVFRNHTDVTTVVIAELPFVRIEQCEEEVSADEISESSCSLHTKTDDLSIQLSCTVVGAKPIVDLIWEASMPSQYWKQVMDESTLTTRARGYGIFDQSLTVNVDASHIKSSKQHFTCVGKGLAVEGVANYTIAVYPAQVIAQRPFIRIEQCENVVPADEINEPCVLHTTPEDRTVQLTCSVVGAKPLVNLTWESSVSSEHWKQLMNQTTLTILERENEIFDQTLTVNIDTTHIKSNKQRFTCIGQGLAVDGMANYTIAVYPARVGSYGTRTVVISIVCTLSFTFLIIGVLWTRRRMRRRRQKSEDPENQEEVNTPLTVESKRESYATSAQIGDALERKGESDASTSEINGDALERKGESDAPPDQIDGDALESKEESDAPYAQIDGDALERKGESDAPQAQIDRYALESKEESDAPYAQIRGDALESKGELDSPSDQINGGALERKGESDAPQENKAPKPDKSKSLETKRTKIKNYQPTDPTDTNKATPHINIGVFGLTNAGKSSLINSLIFALTGNYPTADTGATAADNQKDGSIKKESNKLTDQIYLINFKGMMKYKLDQVSRIYRLREIRLGKGTRNTPKSQIYCPIFILDYSTYTKRCRKFMKGFSDDVRSYFGTGITVVVTKKNTFGGDDAINMMHQNLIKEEMSKATGVTEKRIWIFENYTGDNHEEDVERSIEFLDFISQCLDVVKVNQTFRKK